MRILAGSYILLEGKWREILLTEIQFAPRMYMGSLNKSYCGNVIIVSLVMGLLAVLTRMDMEHQRLNGCLYFDKYC